MEKYQIEPYEAICTSVFCDVVPLYDDGNVQWSFNYAEYNRFDENLFSGFFRSIFVRLTIRSKV